MQARAKAKGRPESMLRLLAVVSAAAFVALTAREAAAQQRTGAPAGQEMRFADQIKAFLDQDRIAPPPKDAILRYIDLNPALFDSRGEPRTELYQPDGLHFHPPAYDLFAAIIKPVLTEAWQQLGSRSTRSEAAVSPR